MSEDKGNEEDKFGLTPEGERYISLDEACVLALRTASASLGSYGSRHQGVVMVFEVVKATERSLYQYMVTLSVRPQDKFVGTPGLEQFLIGKDGTIADLQVLSLPTRALASPPNTGRTGGFPVLPAAIGLVVVGIISAVGAILLISSSGGDSVPMAAVTPTETPAPQTPTFTPMPATLYSKPTLVPTYTLQPILTGSLIVVAPTFTPRLGSTSTPDTPIDPKTKVAINPAESTHRTMVTWTASGFSADSPIIVTYGSEHNRIATSISDGSGRASGTFKIPLDYGTPSSNIIEVTDNSGNTASLFHKIPNPTISTSFPTTPAGSIILVTGRHFPPGRALSDVTIGGIAATPKAIAPQTNGLGAFEIELWIPHQSKGLKSLSVSVQGNNQIISAETTLEITGRLPLTITLDSYEGIRNALVKLDVKSTLANSPLAIMYGPQRTTVATLISNEFGQASGEFLVPTYASIPSDNQVSAVEVTGFSASATHSVPAATINMEWSRVSAGSTIELVGKYFPQSESIEVANIGGFSVLPNPKPVTDLNGDFQLNVLVPHQIPGEKPVMIQVGTGTNAIIASVTLLVQAPEPISVGWNEMSLNAERRWEETGRSNECPSGLCLRANNVPNGSFAEMNLVLWNKRDRRFSSYMERTTVSFEVKTSTEQCCDILRVEHNGSNKGSWSGNTSWTPVQFELSSQRPTMIQWIYEKDKSQFDGEDAVWIRNIQMK